MEATRISRGKYTFLIRLLFAISEPIDAVVPSAKKFHGNEPQSRNSAKEWSPLGCPVGGWILRKTAKMIEKITIVDSGLSSDQVQPSTERLYFPRSSRSVRLSVSSRACAYSWSLLIGALR